eukprot:CAMPEP_0181209356 /NCGR_PEP_ID=MMETSP1096-20121128/22626_1 /TAXON_ID=156174 ORGANISM="Chrysochromulina ericina, Strain CCMP281" /NCGR_SAMPLE_ID=MMETSP1096 /ASSEMBLY_ACC=CAM_ASM_000453 /LENGTH=109 /DNA_ID=CAMNT_0023300519 /DNA_START=1681 /DNA_END=2010 /DNA_ORIENTATION=-
MTFPRLDMSRPAQGEHTKMTAAKLAKMIPTPSSLMPLAFASWGKKAARTEYTAWQHRLATFMQNITSSLLLRRTTLSRAIGVARLLAVGLDSGVVTGEQVPSELSAVSL